MRWLCRACMVLVLIISPCLIGCGKSSTSGPEESVGDPSAAPPGTVAKEPDPNDV